MVRTGAFAQLAYGKEATFQTESTDIDKAFGLEQKVTNWTYTNNRITLSQLGQVQPAAYAFAQTRGNLGIEFVLSNPWWFGLIYDTVTPTGAGPYVYTYTIVDKLAVPFTTHIGIDQATTDINRKATGCVLNSVGISCTVGEFVRCTADIAYGKEARTASLTAAASDTENFPFTFAHGELKWHDGTSERIAIEVQDADVTFNTNADLLYGKGAHTAVGAYKRLFEITGSVRLSMTDDVENDFLKAIYAQTANDGEGLDIEKPSLTFTYESEDGLQKIEMLLTDVAFDEHSLSFEPNEPIFQSINFSARNSSVVVENPTSAEP